MRDASRSSSAKISQLARRVLLSGPVEADVRNCICRLLDAIGFDEYFLEFRTGRGPSDIHLPRQRSIIEVKAAGGADSPSDTVTGGESPLCQLDRYMQAEIARVRSFHEDDSSRRWTGILTDGQVWHSWSYEHRETPVAQPETESYRPNSGSELVNWLKHALRGDPVGKPWIPQNPVEVFYGREYELRDIHDKLSGRVRQETDTKISLWRDMLRSSGMEPESDAARFRLFSTHSFLIALARGVVWTMAHPRETPELEHLLGGGIASWIVQTTIGRQWAESLFNSISSYEWRLRQGDVLKPLYEAFVHADDRRDFGEFYTPDWLAELLIREILDEDWCERATSAALGEIHNQQPIRGVGFLDPCCGSGTFLYHAARRILEHPMIADQPDGMRANIASRLVCGMDVHPVACEFSRATLLRALPCEPPAGASALRIWNGDSLLLHGADENSLFAPRNGEAVFFSPGGYEIRLPEEFVANPGFAGLVGEFTNSAREGRELPPHVEQSVADGEDRRQLRESHMALRRIIQREGNSVWTWFMRQTVGPYILSRHKVDRITSNPPWVTMSTIQARPRKRRLEDFANDINLWQGGAVAPHFDIAQLFVKRSRQQYLNDPKIDPAAWVLKHSAIRGSNWENFRLWRTESGLEGQTLDLAAAQVFGGGDARKCCVLIDKRRTSLEPSASILKARCGIRPSDASTLSEVEGLIRWELPTELLPEATSDYQDTFRNGATTFPHVLAIAEHIAGEGPTRTVTTRRSIHLPWKDIRAQTVEIPLRWLVALLTSQHVLPFALAPEAPDRAILPIDDSGQLLNTETARGYPGWRHLDDLFREFRGLGRITPVDLLQNVNHHGKAGRQLPLSNVPASTQRTLLLYPSSGDIMRACRVPAGSALAGNSTFYAQFETAEETAYLVSLLNAPALNPAFVQSPP